MGVFFGIFGVLFPPPEGHFFLRGPSAKNRVFQAIFDDFSGFWGVFLGPILAVFFDHIFCHFEGFFDENGVFWGFFTIFLKNSPKISQKSPQIFERFFEPFFRGVQKIRAKTPHNWV